MINDTLISQQSGVQDKLISHCFGTFVNFVAISNAFANEYVNLEANEQQFGQ